MQKAQGTLTHSHCQLTADLTLECSDGSMLHLLSHTTWKNTFYCAGTVPNSALHRRRDVLFDQLWANAVSISNRAFLCSNIYAKWWIHYLLISFRALTQLQFTIGKNHLVDFLNVFWHNFQVWAIKAFSIIGVCTAAFKISRTLFYHLSRCSRVRITLVKPLLCLNGIFSHWKAMLYQHTEFRFFHCFENYKSSVTKTTVTCEPNVRLSWNFTLDAKHDGYFR